MDKKSIDRQNPSFFVFFKECVGEHNWRLFEKILSHSTIFVYGSINRKFLLGDINLKDIDLVIDSPILVESLFKNTKFTYNSYGGLKVNLEDKNFDIWNIENTWGIKALHLKPTAQDLLKTPFFNHSSIIYNLNKKKFIYSADFLNYINLNCLDVVNEINRDSDLCLVNTIKYIMEDHNNISSRLCKWFLKHYIKPKDYEPVQLLHWKRVLYSNADINEFYSNLKTRYLHNVIDEFCNRINNLRGNVDDSQNSE